MKRIVLATLILVAVALQGLAQITYPSAYTLSTGAYSLTQWSSSSAAGTYPTSMRFYQLSTMGEPTRSDSIQQDYTAAYNQTSGSRISGRNDTGITFINTGNAVYKMGAAILALNTTNRNTITLQWKGRTVTPNLRTYEIRAYYRVGSTGAWNTLISATGDTMRYARSANANDSAVKGPLTLPAAANNQALVQIMWKYFQVDTNTQTGARAELALDDISVTSQGVASPVLTVGRSTIPAFATRVRVPSTADTFSVQGTGLTDTVKLAAPTGFQIATSASGTYGTNLNLLPASGTLASTIIYARFNPTVAGPASGAIAVSSTGAGTQNVAVSGYAAGATNPPAFVTTGNTYLLNRWDSLGNAAGTYPPNMRFQTVTNDTAPLIYTPFVNDWTCAYNLTSRPRVKGLDTMGFSFINTGSPQYDNCVSGTTALNTFMGGAVLALQTGSDTLTLSYNAGLVAQGDGTTPRVYNLRLQYRTDSTSNFLNAAPVQEYTSAGKLAGDLQAFTYDLPFSLRNIPYLQFRWLYYAVSTNGASGSRPEIRVDEIRVRRKGSTAAVTNVALGTGFVAFPNPVAAGQPLQFSTSISGNVYDAFGRSVASFRNANRLETAGLATGVYSLVTTEGSRCTFVIR